LKPIIYVAHPVTGDVKANCDKVLKWLRWLTEVDPTRIYIAPWVGEVLAHLDMDPIPADFYDRVLSDDEEVVARLDGILLTGIGLDGPYRRPNGFMKSSGMTREVAACAMRGGAVFDMSRYASAEEANSCFRTWNTTKGAEFIEMYRVKEKR
jgi:hypothetical protein